jgi:hypothetical protein
MMKIIDIITEKFARIVKKKKVVFIVFTKSLLVEKNKVIENITKILKEFKDVFSVKSLPNLLLKRKKKTI